MKLPTALDPYGLLIKLGIVVVVLLLAFAGGCHVQKGRDAEKLAKKEAALQASETSLRAAASALRRQNEENDKRIKAAEYQASMAAKAELAADAEAKRQASLLAKAEKDFARKLLIAQRRPNCKLWLETNVEQVCGL